MDGFPAGLRVLVVDDDRTWLKILEKMLIKCSYEVTTCCRAKAALDMLRERKDRFDIVISDVNMPDMDGFKLLEHVGLEMDLPVIMMSVDGETSRVMKGVQHGACDYLLKPIRMKELRIMWQHVYRKKINEMKEIENHDHDSNESTQMKTGLDDSEDEFFLCGSDPNCTKKRKEMGNEENGSQGFNNDSGAAKKVRVVWSVDLHQKFVNAVNQIGFDKVGPKKILDLMNVPGLTRENVASHLQKYRLYLSRLQKKNEPDTTFCGIKQSDFSFEDHPEKSGLQSSTMTEHNSFNRFGYSADKSIIQDLIPEIQENKMKSIVSFLPETEAKSSLRGDVPGALTAPQRGIVHQFGGMISDADCTSFGSTISQKQPWSGESIVMQLMKQGHEPYAGNPRLPSHGQQHHFQLDHEKTNVSTNARKYASYTDKTGPSEPLCADYKSNHVRSVSPIACLTDSISEKLPQGFGAMPVSSTSSSNMKHNPGQQSINCWQSPQSLALKNGSFSASSHEDLQLRSLESYGRLENFWLDSMGFFDLGDSSSITELQSYVHDDLRFNCDYQTDSMEYPIRDEGVFTS